jgi:hypothetical protein
MTTLHSALTSTDLHECKGADAASAGTVRISDGAGGGAWNKISTTNLNTSSIFNANERTITVRLDDVSAPSIVYVPIPFGCTLTAAYTTLGAAITVANSTVTFKDNGGNTAGTLTVAFSGSAAGDVDSTTFASNNTFTIGQRMTVETDGASTTTATLTVVLVFTRTA